VQARSLGPGQGGRSGTPSSVLSPQSESESADHADGWRSTIAHQPPSLLTSTMALRFSDDELDRCLDLEDQLHDGRVW
jgi:hypothetical protein